jgi:hypothetical protein
MPFLLKRTPITRCAVWIPWHVAPHSDRTGGQKARKALASKRRHPRDHRHLGNWSSLTAAKGGKCVDTTMGLTPLEASRWHALRQLRPCDLPNTWQNGHEPQDIDS